MNIEGYFKLKKFLFTFYCFIFFVLIKINIIFEKNILLIFIHTDHELFGYPINNRLSLDNMKQSKQYKQSHFYLALLIIFKTFFKSPSITY